MVKMTPKMQKSYYINLLKSCQTGEDIINMLDMISNEHNTMQNETEIVSEPQSNNKTVLYVEV